MRDYVIGLCVASVVLGLAYLSSEALAGRMVWVQEENRPLAEVVKTLEDPTATEDDRVAALLALGKFEENLEVTVPLIAKYTVYRKSVYRQSATYALAELGEKAVPHLKQYFESKIELDPYEEPANMKQIQRDRSIGCSAAFAIGDSCEVFLPEIKKLIQSDDAKLRACALFALQGMENSAETLMDEVIICLRDENFNNQCFACRIVRNLGPKASKAESELKEILVDGLPSVRGWAAICLGALTPEGNTEENATLLAGRLINTSPVEAVRILDGLGAMGGKAQHVKEAVREKIDHHDRYVQAHAAMALWQIDPTEKIVFKVYGDLLTTDGYEQDGLTLVAEMGAQGLPLLDKIVKRANSPEAITRELVAAAIGRIGPEAKSASDVLQKLSADEDPMVRHAARKALEIVNAGPK